MAGDRPDEPIAPEGSVASLRSAISRARSEDRSEHEQLLDDLCSPEFLDHLDSAEKYEDTDAMLNIEHVLHALGDNSSQSAQDVIVALSQNATFLHEILRVEAVIRASAIVRPPPAELVRFWDGHCQPHDSFKQITLETAVINGTDPAINLFERVMVDERFAPEDKCFAFHRHVLSHRHDVPLLLSCQRLLGGPLPDALRAPLIEALFDYRPGEWYRLRPYPQPPPWEEASQEALKLLQTIGNDALKRIQLTDSRREAVSHSLKEISVLIN